MATSSWQKSPAETAVNPEDPQGSAGFSHVTVLLHEAVQALTLAPAWAEEIGDSGPTPWIADCTLGGGGHSLALLQALPRARLLAFDRDPQALTAAAERLAAYGDRVEYVHAPFAELAGECQRRGIAQLYGIVADLGVSSHQFDTAARGFSFRMDGPLDMRMDPSRGPTVLELLGDVRLEDLADVLYAYGDIRRSIGTARIVLEEVAKGAVTTLALAERLAARLGRDGGKSKIHPATQVFQALRIWVNGELDQLEALLAQGPGLLADGAALAVISFHSGEDRLVKHRFAELAKRGGDFALPERKPMVAGEAELSANPRARSAKLRVLQRRLAVMDEGEDEELDEDELNHQDEGYGEA